MKTAVNECPYCRHSNAGVLSEMLPGHDDSEPGEELYAGIYGTDDNHPYIGVYQDGTNNALFIEINYCPVCGRKLADK